MKKLGSARLRDLPKVTELVKEWRWKASLLISSLGLWTVHPDRSTWSPLTTTFWTRSRFDLLPIHSLCTKTQGWDHKGNSCLIMSRIFTSFALRLTFSEGGVNSLCPAEWLFVFQSLNHSTGAKWQWSFIFRANSKWFVLALWIHREAFPELEWKALWSNNNVSHEWSLGVW